MQLNKHGTFYIRNGWPTKIIDAVIKDEYIFSPNKELDAVDDIGVGRVMIKAMRYWSAAVGLTKEIKESKGVRHQLTDEGKLISKYDPYCQDIGSLWLLHRNLAINYNNATMWAWAFNKQNNRSFSKESLSNEFYTYAQKSGENYSKSAVYKEFDCFKNTYVSDKKFNIFKVLEEDTIPFFAPLKLIRNEGNSKFEFNRPNVKDIPIDVLHYCILLDNLDHLKTNRQISIDELLDGEYQVGKYMCLNYTVLLELLQQLENRKKLSVVNNFGNRYIQIEQADPELVINDYYHEV